MVRVIDADIVAFLTDFIRTEIRTEEILLKYPVMEGFEVSDVEPPVDSAGFPAKLIVVRDDGNSAGDLHLGEVSVGISVLMGAPSNLTDPKLAARVVHGIVRDCARVEAGNPVTVVTESFGPYAVTESQPRARLYSTHSLGTVGESL